MSQKLSEMRQPPADATEACLFLGTEDTTVADERLLSDSVPYIWKEELQSK